MFYYEGEPLRDAQHTLLLTDTCRDWQKMKPIIAPSYRMITGHELTADISFVPAKQIEKRTGSCGAVGAVLYDETVLVSSLNGSSLDALAKFYITLFHELQHVDDQMVDFHQATTLMIRHGLWDRDGDVGQELFWKAERRHPFEMARIDDYFTMEHRVGESRAILFSLLLAERLFLGHPILPVCMKSERSEILETINVYSAEGIGFDDFFERKFFSMIALKHERSITDAYQFLGLPIQEIASIVQSDLDEVRSVGFTKAIIDPVNAFFEGNYNLRPKRIKFEWSGTDKEVNSISHPENRIYMIVNHMREYTFEQFIDDVNMASG